MRFAIFNFLLIAVLALNAKANQLKCEKCNVVIVALDAIQARHVSHLGYSKPTTPHLDEFAKEGISYSQAISPSSWTVPTYLSIFTSTFPSQHGLTNRYERFSTAEKKLGHALSRNPNLKTIAQILKEKGYQTAGFTGDSGVSAVLGYNTGFDIYTEESAFGALANSFEHAQKWFAKKDPNKAYFVFLHGYDSHSQGQLPADFKIDFLNQDSAAHLSPSKEEQAKLREKALKGQNLNATPGEVSKWRAWYDSKIKHADNQFGKFISFLRTQKDFNNTIVVVLSDHGTEFFEHGKVDHGYSLYDELLNVPLIIKVPNAKIKGKVVKNQVTTLDVLPTILSLLDIKLTIPLKKQIVGTDLSGVHLGKEIKSQDAYSETDYRNFTHLRSIRTPEGWKYIIDLNEGKDELYNLNNDPAEKINLVTSENSKVKELKNKLMTHLKDNLGFATSPMSTSCLPVYQGQCVEN